MNTKPYYKVRMEARADILGNVMDRFNVEVDGFNHNSAKENAKTLSHELYNHSYGIPVHFVSTKVSLNN